MGRQPAELCSGITCAVDLGDRLPHFGANTDHDAANYARFAELGWNIVIL